jgi:hypothetical protein
MDFVNQGFEERALTFEEFLAFIIKYFAWDRAKFVSNTFHDSIFRRCQNMHREILTEGSSFNYESALSDSCWYYHSKGVTGQYAILCTSSETFKLYAKGTSSYLLEEIF